MVTVRPVSQQLSGQTFSLDSRQTSPAVQFNIIIIISTSSPDVRGLPQLRVGDPGLGGHGPGSRDHGVQGVLGEVIILARSGEKGRVSMTPAW